MGTNREKPAKSKSDLLVTLAGLPEDDPRLDAAASVLAGETKSESPSYRLYRTGEAATAANISRTSIWRAVKAGRLRTVQLRPGGAKLIPESALRDLVGG